MSSPPDALVLDDALDAAAVADQPLRPLAAKRKNTNIGTWRAVEIRQGCISLSGGFNSRVPIIADSLQLDMDGVQWTFVALHQQAPWFVKGVAGGQAQKGDVKGVKVIQELLHKARSSSDTAVAGPPVAQVEPPVANADDFDPMDDLDAVAVAPSAPKAKAKAKGKAKARAMRAAPRVITMPLRPTCTGQDTGNTTQVCVYTRPKGNNRHSIYLRSDSLNWFLSYGADEYHFQNVDRCEPEVIDDANVGNVSAVADLRVEWDFTGKGWDAEFVAGANQGSQRRLLLKHLTQQHWELMGHTGILRGVTLLERKKHSWWLVVEWCKAIVQGDEDAFQRKWGLVDAAVADTPAKKRRNDEEGTTAVADGDEGCDAGEPNDESQ